ncbi:MAG: TolC family protein, partial [Gammaproteobacteria bacterium]
THRAVIRETRKSYRSITTSINRINALKQAVASAESALSMIKKGYKVGTRTSADVLGAQREVFKARRDYSADKYNYTINYLQLKNLTGTLTRDELVIINNWFK